MELKHCLSEDKINNIYDTYTNVFVVLYDENAKTGGRYIGQLLSKVNITKDKAYIKDGDYVDFRTDKVKWKDGQVAVVDAYWVKLYMDREKLPIKVKVLRSKVVEDVRKYYEDYETIEMTYKQFIKRRLMEEYADVKHSFMEAYSNFQERRKAAGYYKALNETSKHYMIEHEHLKKVIIPRVNNSLKNYKAEWKDLYTRSLKQNKARDAIAELVKQNKEISAEVINIKRGISD